MLTLLESNSTLNYRPRGWLPWTAEVAVFAHPGRKLPTMSVKSFPLFVQESTAKRQSKSLKTG